MQIYLFSKLCHNSFGNLVWKRGREDGICPLLRPANGRFWIEQRRPAI